MAERLFEFLRQFLDAYGYWTLVVVLLLENAGIPAPGETTLLFVSFLAWSERDLHLGYIILVGIAACTVGDNLGYAIGYRGGRPLLDRYQRFLHIPAHTIARGERLFERYGSVTIFFARFIFGNGSSPGLWRASCGCRGRSSFSSTSLAPPSGSRLSHW